MTARKLVVVALGVLLACQLSAADPQPASPDAPYRSDLPIHRVIRAISAIAPGQLLARPGVRPRPGGTGPNNGNETAETPEEECNCVPFVACASLYNQVTTTCKLGDDGLGVCCPPKLPPGINRADNRLFKEPRAQVAMRSFSAEEINKAVQEGLSYLDGVHELESRLISSNQIVQEFTPEYSHLKFFDVTPTARQGHEAAMQVAQASRALMSDFNLTPAQGRSGLQQLSVRQSPLGGNCPAAPQCNPNAKYRTIDGTCNNLANPLWGKSETAFQRILPPIYGDAVSTPRTLSVTNAPLPLVREISTSILVDNSNEDQDFTLSVMQWAQFIDHDITLSPFRTLINSDMGINCCLNNQVPISPLPDECFPIELPANDAFYSPKGIFCMNFVRSMLALGPGCNFGYAEQVNVLTHWLDGSNIYGSTAMEAARLRFNQSGLLLLSDGDLLPINAEAEECLADQRGGECYRAGDTRVNEQPGLTAIHTIFAREHNRVAGILLAKHPTWSDEILYQEARRIVVAEYQYIMFNEWLPIIVGEPFMQSFGLYDPDYLSDVNPTINNEFATAAFRFGHTLVQGIFNLYGPNGGIQTLRLRDHFNSPHVFSTTADALDMFARSFTRQAIQKFDSFVTQELTNHLFQQPGANFGMDLMSLNLQRGRDHGIVTYNDMRVQCGLPRAQTFQDFNDQIPHNIVQKLDALYAHPDDVDFFVGGISETPVSGGLLGWTFLCVVGDQFARLRLGDRFFFDLNGQAGSFTRAQQNQIFLASWARILCDNTKIGTVQPLAFRLQHNYLNPRSSCDNSPNIPKVNIKGYF